MNISLETGTFPENMKIAKIILIYKSKDKQLLNNYRPISLLPVFSSKILEKIVHKRVYTFLDANNKFNDNQFGFRPGHNTINAVSLLANHVMNYVESNKYTLGVFLDLSKGFDTIDYSILLHKLEYYGVRGVALQWFRSYLNTRKQYVTHKDAKSEFKNLDCGVPQGSILGPLLFIIYCNDLPNALKHTNCILYADDTTIYYSTDNLQSLYTVMNSDLGMLSNWYMANKLSLNAAKSQYVLFKNNRPIENNYQILMNNEIIKQTKTAKFLGITIDEGMTWQEHIHSCKKRASSGLYALNSAKKILSESNLKILYHSLIHPHLMYGLMLWGSACKKYLHPINIIQKKAVRTITHSVYNEHTIGLFRKLNIVKLDDLYDLEIGKCMYLFATSGLPKPLNTIYATNDQIHMHNTRHSRDAHIQIQITQKLARSFVCKGPKLWQNLQHDLKSCKSYVSFKNKFKRNILQKYN